MSAPENGFTDEDGSEVETFSIAIPEYAPGEEPGTTRVLEEHSNDCWLDLYDMVAEGILMPLGALVMTILIGWVLKPEVVQLECEQSGLKYRAAGYFKLCFKFIVPVLLAFILFCQLIDFFGLKIPGLS